MSVHDFLKKLKEKNPEAFADGKPKEEVINLEEEIKKVDENTPPSVMKKLSEAIAKKRMTAPGLTETELQGLMKEIKR